MRDGLEVCRRHTKIRLPHYTSLMQKINLRLNFTLKLHPAAGEVQRGPAGGADGIVWRRSSLTLAAEQLYVDRHTHADLVCVSLSLSISHTRTLFPGKPPASLVLYFSGVSAAISVVWQRPIFSSPNKHNQLSSSFVHNTSRS